jgi:uncharacterized protein YecE (DUF72 family)
MLMVMLRCRLRLGASHAVWRRPETHGSLPDGTSGIIEIFRNIRYSLLAVRDGVTYVGTAGWANPRGCARPAHRSQLEHYAKRFNCVEVNSSFYRSHRRETYARWADTTDADFRFSVKFPRTITHEHALRRCGTLLDAFLREIEGLGPKLGVLLLQLPPRLEWQAGLGRFFAMLRDRSAAPVVCEPRHASWSTARAQRQMASYAVSLVRADPARIPRVASLANAIQYHRLHGSPRVYWSSYSADYLRELAEEITVQRDGVNTQWCIFDNTAAGAAWPNALALNDALRRRAGIGRRGQATPWRQRMARAQSHKQKRVVAAGISDLKRPVRVQLRRANGWRMPANTVKVDRSTPWGNPFRLADGYTAVAAVDTFARWLRGASGVKCGQRPPTASEIIAALGGKNLGCWCRTGSPCHAEVLLQLANPRSGRSQEKNSRSAPRRGRRLSE